MGAPAIALRRTQAQRSAATRQHLIDTAIEVIERRSLEDVSIHEIARSAGMTSGAVQHHFESKAVLMMNILSALLQEQLDAGALWPAASLSARERATRFVDTAWRLIYAQPRFIVAWNIYLGSRSQPEILQHVARLRAEIGAQLEAGFFDAFPELSAAPDRQAFLGLVFSALRGLGLLQLFPGAAQPLPLGQPDAQLACLADLIAARCENAR
jgi:AcrR family transcriptional regulator